MDKTQVNLYIIMVEIRNDIVIRLPRHTYQIYVFKWKEIGHVL